MLVMYPCLEVYFDFLHFDRVFVRRIWYSLVGADVWFTADIWRMCDTLNGLWENPTVLWHSLFIKVVEENSPGQNINAHPETVNLEYIFLKHSHVHTEGHEY